MKYEYHAVYHLYTMTHTAYHTHINKHNKPYAILYTMTHTAYYTHVNEHAMPYANLCYLRDKKLVLQASSKNIG